MRSPDSNQKDNTVEDIVNALKDVRRLSDKNDAKVLFVELLEGKDCFKEADLPIEQRPVFWNAYV